MAYSLYDEKGYVGPVASIEGYGEMLETARWGTYPALQKLFARGLSTQPKAVYNDLNRLLQKVTAMDSNVQHTFENLKELMAKEQNSEVVIIHG